MQSTAQQLVQGSSADHNVGNHPTPWLWNAQQQREALAKLERDIRLTEHAMGSLHQAKIALSLMHKTLKEIAQELQKALRNPEHIGKALQSWLSQRIKHLDTYSANAHFGPLNLLSGTLGAKGWSTEDGFQFVMASALTKSSPAKGYKVRITQEPVPSHIQGQLALTPEVLNRGITLMLRIGSTVIGCEIQGKVPVVDFLRWMQYEVYKHQLPLVVSLSTKGHIHIRHLQCGSSYGFWVRCAPVTLLGVANPNWHWVGNGLDVQGEIHHEPGIGQGSLLMGRTGNPRTTGLVVERVQNHPFGVSIHTPQPPKTGWIHVLQSSLRLHALDEGNDSKFILHLAPARARDLAKGVNTTSNFTSLATMQAGNPRQTMDCYTMACKALEEIAFSLCTIEDLRLQTGPSALSQLKIHAQNLFAYAHIKPHMVQPIAQKPQSDLNDICLKMQQRLRLKLNRKAWVAPLKPWQGLNMVAHKERADLMWN